MRAHTHAVVILGDGHTITFIEGEALQHMPSVFAAAHAVGIVKWEEQKCMVDHDFEAFKKQLKAVKAGYREDHDYGGAVTRWYVYPADMTDAEVSYDLEIHGERVEVEHCPHVYDCCARWYSNGLWIKKRTSTRVLATVNIYQNV